MGSRGVVVVVLVVLAGLAHARPYSEELADQGKYKEAIAEAQRLIKLQPTAAAHLEALAYVYIQAGMGEAARRTARAAIQLEPNRGTAHAMLGWVLEFDTLGRRYGRGYDRVGALAELARASALDAREISFVAEQAKLLERGTGGGRFDPGCDLRAAAEAWRIVRTVHDTDGHRIAHAAVLLASGNAATAESVLRSAQASDDRDALLVAAIAVQRGGGTARKATTSPDVLHHAWLELFKMRQYDAARALGVQPPGALGQMEKSLARVDASPVPRTDPRSAMIGVLRFAIDDPYPRDLFVDAQTERELRDRVVNPLNELRAADFPREAMLDGAVAGATIAIDGASPLWRVTMDSFGNHAAMYVVLDGGVTKVIGTMEAPAGAGRHVRALVARNELGSAGRLLDWVATDLAKSKQASALRFESVWTATSPRDAATMLLAGALLAPEKDTSTRATFTGCASTAAAAREACDAALAAGLYAGREWPALLAHTAAWTAHAKDPLEPGLWRIQALVRLGRLPEAEKLASELYAKHAGEPRLLWMRAVVALQRRDVPEAMRRFDAVVKTDDSYANGVAWVRVTEHIDLDVALWFVHRATMKPNPSASALNTQALIEAELGDLATARTDEWAALDKRPQGEPNESDWYVIGRIAEQLGLRDDAIADYRKVPRSEPDLQKTVYELAQERLKALGVK